MDSLELYLEEVVEWYVNENKAILEGIDDVTIISLLRSSLEIENPELPKSSVIIRDVRNKGELHSIKLKNIKFNLSFALDTILGLYTILGPEEKEGLVLAMLKFIRDLFKEMDEKIEKKDVLVLREIYSLDFDGNGVAKDKIELELKVANIEDSLERLEKLNCIVCVEQKYTVIEYIMGEK